MSEGASIDELAREIEAERARLGESVSALREHIDRARSKPLRVGLPAIAGAAVVGFVVAGGVRSTIRLLAVRERRRRERAASHGVLRSLLGRRS